MIQKCKCHPKQIDKLHAMPRKRKETPQSVAHYAIIYILQKINRADQSCINICANILMFDPKTYALA